MIRYYVLQVPPIQNVNQFLQELVNLTYDLIVHGYGKMEVGKWVGVTNIFESTFLAPICMYAYMHHEKQKSGGEVKRARDHKGYVALCASQPRALHTSGKRKRFSTCKKKRKRGKRERERKNRTLGQIWGILGRLPSKTADLICSTVLYSL